MLKLEAFKAVELKNIASVIGGYVSSDYSKNTGVGTKPCPNGCGDYDYRSDKESRVDYASGSVTTWTPYGVFINTCDGDYSNDGKTSL